MANEIISSNRTDEEWQRAKDEADRVKYSAWRSDFHQTPPPVGATGEPDRSVLSQKPRGYAPIAAPPPSGAEAQTAEADEEPETEEEQGDPLFQADVAAAMKDGFGKRDARRVARANAKRTRAWRR